ncbi:hypothetical protein G4B88_016495 [Cannabis sativa]|uniref:Uncharacterized protein n=1 Tax=Cannabis sativa TaxID=3483 RepID=A0A7J6H7V0_CANSA|nr:hypothetical protein G4B88_016495 [Cannabis sativa]
MEVVMKMEIKETTMVKPATETPRHVLWTSNLDQMVPKYIHIPTIHFYKPLSSVTDEGFFDPVKLKDALSKVLVPFYPVAGRLVDSSNPNGDRIEIDCNGEGVLFVVAQTNSMVDDFGDFKPSPKLRALVPIVEYSIDISSHPLLLLQVL